MYNDQTMYVYGGFSQRCEDFCDDIWFYDMYVGGWRQVYAAGVLSKLYYETVDITKVYYSANEVPNITNGWAGPGRRWRHSMVAGKEYKDESTGKMYQNMAIFGGHRLWHGFAADNSKENSWDSYEKLPPGGYLDDLWIYTKELDTKTVPGETLKQSNGRWKFMDANITCRPNPGRTWSQRNDQICERLWPNPRAGHGSVYDTKRNRIWIFGGYNTYFPYLSTDGIGAGINFFILLH